MLYRALSQPDAWRCSRSEDAAVYGELCRAIDEWIALLLAEEHQLPPPTSLTKIEALIST